MEDDLLGFAAPPSAASPEQLEQEPAAEASVDLLGFGDFAGGDPLTPATTSTVASSEPLVDLFGGPSIPTNDIQQQQQQQQQQSEPLDVFAPDTIAPKQDSFDAPALAATTEDPFGVFLQTPSPPVEHASLADPFAAPTDLATEPADTSTAVEAPHTETAVATLSSEEQDTGPFQENNNGMVSDNSPITVGEEEPSSSPIPPVDGDEPPETSKDNADAPPSLLSPEHTGFEEKKDPESPQQLLVVVEPLETKTAPETVLAANTGSGTTEIESSSIDVTQISSKQASEEIETTTPEEAAVTTKVTNAIEKEDLTQPPEINNPNIPAAPEEPVEESPEPETSEADVAVVTPETTIESETETAVTPAQEASPDAEATAASKETTAAVATGTKEPATTEEPTRAESSNQTEPAAPAPAQESTSTTAETKETVDGNSGNEVSDLEEVILTPNDNTTDGEMVSHDATATEQTMVEDTPPVVEEGPSKQKELTRETNDSPKEQQQQQASTAVSPPTENANEAATNNEKNQQPKASSSTLAASSATTTKAAPRISTNTPKPTTVNTASVVKGFASLKNMAGNMASRHAANVAAAAAAQKSSEAPKAQAKATVTSATTKANMANRFATFKSMAGDIAAKGKAGVASVNVPQVQVSHRLSKMSLFNNNSSSHGGSSHGGSNHDSKPIAAVSKSSTSTDTVKRDNDITPKSEVPVISETSANTEAEQTTDSSNGVDATSTPPPSQMPVISDIQSDPGQTMMDRASPLDDNATVLEQMGKEPEESPQEHDRSTSNEEQSSSAEEELPPHTVSTKAQEKAAKDSSESAKNEVPTATETPTESITGTIEQVQSSTTTLEPEQEQSTETTQEQPAVTANKEIPKKEQSSKTTAEIKSSESVPSDVKDESSKTAESTVVPQSETVAPNPAAAQSITSGTDQIAVLQKELHAAHTLIMQLQHHDNVEEERPGDAVMVELQANLEKEMTRRAEAEETSRRAIAKAQRIEEEYKTFKEGATSNLTDLTAQLESLTEENTVMENELLEIREERDEQARKEMALTTRLNAAKKKEAVKANAAEHYEEQVDQLETSVRDYKAQVESLEAERKQLQGELAEWKQYAEKRTKQLETALNDEKKLNEERKKKMKGFVEAKTEEVRVAKSDYLSLQSELDQNTHSLKELNQRYKQLHAQWVQAQTRNRELQRDAMKMKKDSEKMHKVGDSLEARLSRSAQQSEDHKNKRIHARNELMSVLGQLEAERAVNNRLEESIRLTFTPKALAQQQTVQEALDEFEGALQKLSVRIGRPVPLSMGNESSFNDTPNMDDDDMDVNLTEETNEGDKPSTVNLSEINTNKAIQKLENETQRVSQSILAFSSSIERMHTLLDGGGTKSCVDVLSQLLLMNSSTSGTAIAAGATRRSGGGRGGQRYGQISPNMN